MCCARDGGSSTRSIASGPQASASWPSKTFDALLVADALEGPFFGTFRLPGPLLTRWPVNPFTMEPILEFLSPAWFSALLAIVLIDLVLAGDNAIVIALAARNLPDHLRKRAVLWGTVGAIVVRAAMTLVVVRLLKVPGLMLVGGLGLIWIAYQLLVPSEGAEGHGSGVSSFWAAMKTIVVADALMGVDNVLGVAGAAHGSFDLVVVGLLLSVPIMVWGSSLVLKLIDRYPAITYIGAGVLAFTAAKMIVSEPLLDAVFDPHFAARLALYAALVVGVLMAGRWAARRANLNTVSPATPTA